MHGNNVGNYKFFEEAPSKKTNPNGVASDSKRPTARKRYKKNVMEKGWLEGVRWRRAEEEKESKEEKKMKKKEGMEEENGVIEKRKIIITKRVKRIEGRVREVGKMKGRMRGLGEMEKKVRSTCALQWNLQDNDCFGE